MAIPQTKDDIIDVDVIEVKEESHYRNGKVVCKECDKEFLMIPATHLRKHKMTVAQYKKKYPGAPVNCKATYDKHRIPDALLPIKKNVFVDEHGNIRNRDTGLLISSGRALTDKTKKLSIQPKTFKDYAETYSEQLYIWLVSVIEYDQGRIGHKTPLYSTADKFKAADMIHKSLPKPATEKTIDTTIKKLSVTIGQTLPKNLKIEDF